ncbi:MULTISPECIES: carboxymuconolactone decarboxylase family protein [Burkholderia]|uniref:carboxymuconolactone decarboxylase family protein n=1 Tax=Burkholderia TaxID=32008 RepID=UPI000B0BE3E1|nr:MULTISPECIES: carboxymuconolactone decarboxylase family protein [Burkholderia]
MLDGFFRMHRPALAGSAIDERDKQLIAIAAQCDDYIDDCIGYYVHEALHAGASDREILDAAGVVVMMGGGPAVVYAYHGRGVRAVLRGRVIGAARCGAGRHGDRRRSRPGGAIFRARLGRAIVGVRRRSVGGATRCDSRFGFHAGCRCR